MLNRALSSSSIVSFSQTAFIFPTSKIMSISCLLEKKEQNNKTKTKQQSYRMYVKL